MTKVLTSSINQWKVCGTIITDFSTSLQLSRYFDQLREYEKESKKDSKTLMAEIFVLKREKADLITKMEDMMLRLNELEQIIGVSND